MIVTIDGPAGAGKSSIAKQVSQRLGFEFLDTGALYRAVTLGAIRKSIDLDDSTALVRYAKSVRLQWKNNRVLLDGEDVSDEIRTATVTDTIRYVADLPDVRTQLSKLQRQIANDRDIVTEGRDQGTEVFPNAECKIFLTASPDERARRRHQQLSEAGQFMTIDEIRRAQDLRDELDCRRPVGALTQAADSVVITSDGMAPEQVIDQIVQVVQSRR